MQARILLIGLGVKLLLGTRRVIAQALHLISRFGPDRAQTAAAIVKYHCALLADRKTIALLNFTYNMA